MPGSLRTRRRQTQPSQIVHQGFLSFSSPTPEAPHRDLYIRPSGLRHQRRHFHPIAMAHHRIIFIQAIAQIFRRNPCQHRRQRIESERIALRGQCLICSILRSETRACQHRYHRSDLHHVSQPPHIRPQLRASAKLRTNVTKTSSIERHQQHQMKIAFDCSLSSSLPSQGYGEKDTLALSMPWVLKSWNSRETSFVLIPTHTGIPLTPTRRQNQRVICLLGTLRYSRRELIRIPRHPVLEV